MKISQRAATSHHNLPLQTDKRMRHKAEFAVRPKARTIRDKQVFCGPTLIERDKVAPDVTAIGHIRRHPDKLDDSAGSRWMLG